MRILLDFIGKKISKFFVFQLIVSKETLAKNNHLSRNHIQEMQANITKIMNANDTLNSDLQTASKTIVSRFDYIKLNHILNHLAQIFQVELEMKLKAYEKLIACEQATAK